MADSSSPCAFKGLTLYKAVVGAVRFAHFCANQQQHSIFKTVDITHYVKTTYVNAVGEYTQYSTVGVGVLKNEMKIKKNKKNLQKTFRVC